MGGSKSIQFKTGDTNQTYHITIKQDQLCEMEFFYVNIDLNCDAQPLDVNVSQAKVFINDSNKPECGKGPILQFYQSPCISYGKYRLSSKTFIV